jgi:hypothetical protein
MKLTAIIPYILISLGVIVRFIKFPYISYLLIDFYQSMHLVEDTEEDTFDCDRMNKYIGYSFMIMGVVLIIGNYISFVLFPDAVLISQIIVGVMVFDLAAIAKRYDKSQPKGLKQLLLHWLILACVTVMLYYSAQTYY